MVVVGSGFSDVDSPGQGIVGSMPSQGIGVFAASADPLHAREWRYLGGLDRLGDLLKSHDIKEAAICLDMQDWARLESVVRTCADHGVAVTIPLAVGPEQIATAQPAARMADAAVKRAIDIIGAAVGLVVAAPFLAAAALIILVMDGPPVMFRQQRAGLHGRAFEIFKFRTMRRDADSMRSDLRSSNEIDGAAFKMERDPRVTRLGQWLRRTSLDELPQLWNVLRGEMSLVGPRPHPYDDVARYKPWHLRRLAAKPGMTGLWQVELRGETDFDRCVEKDIEYIERSSVWLDLDILLRTIPAVLRGTGR